MARLIAIFFVALTCTSAPETALGATAKPRRRRA